MRKALVLLSAFVMALGMGSCGGDASGNGAAATSETAAHTTDHAEATTAAVTETTAESSEATSESATTTTTTTSTTAATTATTSTTAAAATTTAAVTTTMLEGGLPTHNLPVPGVHNFDLPADCPYGFDDISFHAINYFEHHTNCNVQYAEAEKLEGDILTIHVYNIVDFNAIDYEYYYVNYHNLKGTDCDGNPVDLESTEHTAWSAGTAINSIDFGMSFGAALYLGKLESGRFDKNAVLDVLNRPENKAYVEKYTFLRDIPESNYVFGVNGVQKGAELWMLVPLSTIHKTEIIVENKNASGKSESEVYHSAFGAPIILACNAEGWNDFYVTFLGEMDGVARTFHPYITKDTCVPASSEDFIKILN